MPLKQRFARIKNLIDTNHGTHRGLIRWLLGQLEGVLGPRERFRTVSPDKVDRLVFVCLGNINRSAFAHAVAAARGARCISIGLATTTGAPATQAARRLAPEFGVSLEAHAATDITDYVPAPGDLLLVMELRHAHRLVARGIPARQIALLGQWAHPIRYHIHDPDTLSDNYFRTCFATLQPAVWRLLTEFAESGSPSMPS